MSWLHLVILSPFLLAFFVPLLYRKFQRIHTGWFVLPLPLVLFIYFTQYISGVSKGETYLHSMKWIPSLGINFDAYVDGLGLLFSLLITGIGTLVILYSIYYLSKTKEALHSFYVYLLLFMGSMLGVVLSDNLMSLYSFWELTSLSSFLLIGYWYKREKSQYGALKSMLITVFGGLSLLAGIVLLYVMTGTFSIREIISNVDVVTSSHLFIPALVLILLGAFTKSAQFPFHIWLPDAMEAPTPVSAYLHSATMVKAGIYLLARLSPVFAISATWFFVISITGLITLFWGSFSAVKQQDLKGILAFSTISQLGMIMSLIGVGSAAIHYDFLDDNIYLVALTAAVFHLINHATFKGSLFMVVGIVDHETGTRDIRKLGGLMSFMPVTFTIAIIGGFAMAGLPPFNGFLSKEMFFTGMVNVTKMDMYSMQTWGILLPIIAWVGSIFTFVYSMILVFKTFTGKYQPEKLEKKPHEAPVGMLISPVILASLVVIFGFAPNLLESTLIEPTMASIAPSLLAEGKEYQVHIKFWHGFTPELFMTLGVITFGILLFMTLQKWSKIYTRFPSSLTLNNGYNYGIKGMEKGSTRIMKTFMTGFIRDYLLIIFTFIGILILVTLFSQNAFAIDLKDTASIGVYEAILAVVMVAATITTLLAKSRLTAIISLGVVGYTLSLFFVLFRAPDLALTQLVIETVSVSLFLLCFYYLPEFRKRKVRVKFQLPNLLVALLVGTTVTLLGISANSTKLFESISHYFIENSYEKAGGENMVNVILVDFRGFDTLFEITVLCIAALAIYGMIRLRLTKEEEE
ncbi:Na+/H+ antiporter subunit A [Priestia aryabhattai]|uniref:Na+/H+ antiporter subunit A n=1 Tax=Priestia aryabhattai TaxID=412384 RepID=UPI0008DE19F8|nr:Na+/H+ antiporter subunit A [Priestia aryabhattai]MBX9968743.1 Na+/H+ antiporter subunit A [Priestia aryabhattai]MBZ6484359.1 Na+/H+ antiporter subunit A [Priestia aryabhattai]MDH3112145.1 Na+/H+ antiporter subunit A [Priestia aryabhattai]MDH3128939.1 Na+/H+ antiporter subunit A [Priestia aryabhattai]MDH3130856.1 Na+/H+ antiporter subunit A [Priestia aryabhattai]